MFDNVTRYFLAACFAVFLAVLGIAAALGPTGCAKNTRKDTIYVSLLAVNSSRVAFTAWDLARQREILAASPDRAAVSFAASLARQHVLYFFPLPQGHGTLRR